MDVLVKMSESIYQATDGKMLIDTYHIYWTPDYPLSGSHIRFSVCDDGCTQCTSPAGGAVILGPERWDWKHDCSYNDHTRWAGRTASHEFLHCWPGLDDEYRGHGDHADQACGHSIMNGPTDTDILTNVEDLCTTQNAGYDASPRPHMDCATNSDCAPWGLSVTECRTNQWTCGHITTSSYPWGWHQLHLAYPAIAELVATPDPYKFWTDTSAGDDPFRNFIAFYQYW